MPEGGRGVGKGEAKCRKSGGGRRDAVGGVADGPGGHGGGVGG